MENFYELASLVFGVSLALAGICLFLAVREKERLYLMYGLLGLIPSILYTVFPFNVSVDPSHAVLLSALFILSLVMTTLVALRLLKRLRQFHTMVRDLTAYELQWRKFMDNTPLIILELDRKGNIVQINDFGAKILGYKRASDVSRLNWLDQFIEKDEVEYARKCFQDVQTKNPPFPPLKLGVKTKSGDLLAITWSAFKVTDEHGELQGVMSIGKDVTDHERTNRLVEKLKSDLIREQLGADHGPNSGDFELVGASEAVTYAIQKARQVAVTQAPVLLEGETGVGKELFANMIHRNSTRSDKPFIKINCGALPKELIEDELFGHDRGAFTSAHQQRKGRFELADGGTLFLDEVGELPLDMQPKLLRVLQTGEFERIGGQKTIKVDVRILAATNKTLSEEAEAGRFRSDLYYRLNVFPITIPSLRNRKEDLPLLITYFISTKSKIYGKAFDQISHSNMQRLMSYHWPGNVRELQNVIERAVIMSEGTTLRFNWWDTGRLTARESDGDNLERVEHDHIVAVLEKCGWQINGKNGGAEMLGMNPNTLRSRMKRLGIQRPARKVS